MINMTFQICGVVLEMAMSGAGATEIHLKQFLVTVASSFVLVLLGTTGAVYRISLIAIRKATLTTKTTTTMATTMAPTGITLTPTTTGTTYLCIVEMNVRLDGLHLGVL